MEPSDHLLRTLAAVPPDARVVDLGCGDGCHAESLARLGFDWWAVDPDPTCVDATRQRLAPIAGEDDAARRVTRARLDALGYPDAYADWAILAGGRMGTRGAFPEVARVLRPGAWVWVGGDEDDGWAAAAASAGLVVAEKPGRDRTGWAHAIFRRPARAA